MIDLLELNSSDDHCERILTFSGIDIIESAERSGVTTDIEVHDVSLLCHIIIPFELKVNGCSGFESKDRASVAAQESGFTSCEAAGIPVNAEIAKVRKARDDNVLFIYYRRE